MIVRQVLPWLRYCMAHLRETLYWGKKKDVSLTGWLRIHVFQHRPCGLEAHSELDNSQEWISFIIFKSITISCIPRPQTPSLSNTITSKWRIKQEKYNLKDLHWIYLEGEVKPKRTHFDDQAFRKNAKITLAQLLKVTSLTPWNCTHINRVFIINSSHLFILGFERGLIISESLAMRWWVSLGEMESGNLSLRWKAFST